jgi:hypothetical protein
MLHILTYGERQTDTHTSHIDVYGELSLQGKKAFEVWADRYIHVYIRVCIEKDTAAIHHKDNKFIIYIYIYIYIYILYVKHTQTHSFIAKDRQTHTHDSHTDRWRE